MCEVVVNDLLDELSDENGRLFEEILFLNQYFQVLNEFRVYLNKLLSLKTVLKDLHHLSPEEHRRLDEFDTKYNVIIAEAADKSSTVTADKCLLDNRHLRPNETIETQKQIMINISESDDDSDSRPTITYSKESRVVSKATPISGQQMSSDKRPTARKKTTIPALKRPLDSNVQSDHALKQAKQLPPQPKSTSNTPMVIVFTNTPIQGSSAVLTPRPQPITTYSRRDIQLPVPSQPSPQPSTPAAPLSKAKKPLVDNRVKKQNKMHAKAIDTKEPFICSHSDCYEVLNNMDEFKDHWKRCHGTDEQLTESLPDRQLHRRRDRPILPAPQQLASQVPLQPTPPAAAPIVIIDRIYKPLPDKPLRKLNRMHLTDVEGSPFICSHSACQQVLNNMDEFNDHWTECHGADGELIGPLADRNSSHTCPNCLKFFVSSAQCQTHIKSCAGPLTAATTSTASLLNDLICSFGGCKSYFHTMDEYYQHVNAEHLKYECSVCQKRFTSVQVLTNHELRHRTPTGSEAVISAAVTRHPSAKTPSLDNTQEGYRYTACGVCHLVFTVEGEHTAHDQLFARQDILHMCHECHQLMFTEENMLLHNYWFHKRRFLSCNVCDFITDTALALQKHEYEHSVGAHPQYRLANRFNCFRCNDRYVSEARFRKHLEVRHKIHRKSMKHMCRHCGKCFLNKPQQHTCTTRLNDQHLLPTTSDPHLITDSEPSTAAVRELPAVDIKREVIEENTIELTESEDNKPKFRLITEIIMSSRTAADS